MGNSRRIDGKVMLLKNVSAESSVELHSHCMDILPGSFTHFWPGFVGSPAYPFAHLKSRVIIVRKYFFKRQKTKTKIGLIN